jgi:tripartite-type tricarboxylate transporter receptor subunit TctC
MGGKSVIFNCKVKTVVSEFTSVNMRVSDRLARCSLLGVFVVTVFLSFCGAFSAHAQSSASGPIRIVVPFAPGAAIDVVGRMLANTLSTQTGRTVIVDNRPGARTYLGAEAVARSEPNGDTLFFSVDDTFTMVPHLTKSVAFDPMKELVPVNLVGTITMVMVATPSLPATTLQQLIDYAKANPTSVNYGSSGVGSATQLAMETLKTQAKVSMAHIPYRGLAPVANALMSDEVQVSVLGYGSSRGMIEGGKLRVLAITSPDSVPSLPNVPTTRELNYPDVQATPRLILTVSSKTPPDIVSRLYQMVSRALKDPELRKQIESRDIVVTDIGPEQALADLKRYSKFNAAVMHSAGIQAE